MKTTPDYEAKNEEIVRSIKDAMPSSAPVTMGNPNAWAIWSEVTRAVGVARDLSVISDLDCACSISDETDRENARRALVSAIFSFLDKADKLLSEIEPNLHGVIQ